MVQLRVQGYESSWNPCILGAVESTLSLIGMVVPAAGTLGSNVPLIR